MSMDAILDQAKKVRHELHRVPELCYEEFKTAEIIRAELERLKLDYVTGPESAPTATIAVLGDETKPCVLLRADIDGLPISEATGVSYASTHEGKMHACGHDGHAANLLAVAATLAEEASTLPVCVKLVWQPAEEGGAGGRKLVDAGVCDETGRFGPRVAAAFGLHGWPLLPLGMVSTKPGALLAATDNFQATFRGTGGHAAMAHLTTDPLACAINGASSLQQIAAREIDPTEPFVLSTTQFNAGTTHNVVPDFATFGGTVRTVSAHVREFAEEAVRRRCEAAAAAGRCDLEFAWHRGYPATVNDPRMTEYATNIFKRVLGPDRFMPTARATMGGEDFAYFLEKVPGCFYLLGLLPAAKDVYPSLHTDRFDFTDEAFATGVETMCALVHHFDLPD